MKRLALLLCTCLLSATFALVAGPASGSTTLTGPFHTTGNQILDASNQPVRFRGIDRVVTGMRPVTEYEIDHARQWGANMIRLTLDEDDWTQLCVTTSYDPGYQSYIDNIVSWVTSRGMVALLELASNPRFTCDPQAAGNKRMADYPGSIVFWQGIANRYKNNPLVAFDLYNEPHDISASVWRNGGTVQDGAVLWAVAGMQQMYNAVRGTGAANLVIVSGLDWAATPPTNLLNGYDIAYGVHMYTCPHSPPPNCTYPKKVGPMGLITVKVPIANPYDPSGLFNRWAPLSQTQPLVITEFGWPDPNDGIYNANLVAEAEQRGWSWIGYAWLGSPSGAFTLLANCGPGANYDPTPSGVPIRQGLLLNS